jgi:hypothetical protein
VSLVAETIEPVPEINVTLLFQSRLPPECNEEWFRCRVSQRAAQRIGVTSSLTLIRSAKLACSTHWATGIR